MVGREDSGDGGSSGGGGERFIHTYIQSLFNNITLYEHVEQIATHTYHTEPTLPCMFN